MSPSQTLTLSELRSRLNDEQLLSAGEASLVLKARPEVLIRWITRGQNGRQLEGYFDNATRQWYTSAEALYRFQTGKG